MLVFVSTREPVECRARRASLISFTECHPGREPPLKGIRVLMQAGKASAATFDRTTSFPAGQRGRAGSLHGMMSSVLCSLQHISNFEADFRPASKNR
jgi:hypothetical protein